jgi:hypothetical protein
MSNYTAQLTITAQSAWKTWYAASEIATEKTEAAITWYGNTFFSEEAQTTYTTIGEAIGHLMVATVIVGMIARRRLQPWIDAQVESCLAQPEAEGTEDAPADAPAMVNPFGPANRYYATVSNLAQTTAPAAIEFKVWVLKAIFGLYREVKRLYA